jgi:hypothetical protein
VKVFIEFTLLNLFNSENMKEYLFIYRTDYSVMPQGTPEEKEAVTKSWMDWISSIAVQNKLADRGNRLASSGKVVRKDKMVTNGPYSEIKESIGGYSLVRADSYEEAIELAEGCPILHFGGNVEIREISTI